MIEILKEADGKFSGMRAKMMVMAKQRSEMTADYLEQINATLRK